MATIPAPPHPNIVSVHEVGREGDTVCIVSDLVRGVTLADRLTACRLSPREAAQLCVTIAEALHLDHECDAARTADLRRE